MAVIVLLDDDRTVVGTLPYDTKPDDVLITELGVFVYDGDDGDDHVYVRTSREETR